MKHSVKNKIGAALAALAALSLCACSSAVTESEFDSPKPWNPNNGSAYERLDYTVEIFDASDGFDEDARVKIADGTMSFTLNEPLVGIGVYSTLDMEFSVTYSADAPAPDAGLTDTISSTVKFTQNTLLATYMEKEVTLADREGVQNLSYRTTADYFDSHVATFEYTAQSGAEQLTMDIPRNTYRDNEMMYLLARAQNLEAGTSTVFKMVNMFDSFDRNKLTEYTMACTTSEVQNIELGEFVSEFGVEAVTNEQTGNATYPVACFASTIGINAEKAGPPNAVWYSQNPFVKGGVEHAKIPVRIAYSQYDGYMPYRYTVYTLSGCSFDRPE